ncbi:hypothetical protein ID858_10500 [Xenorhabdus sp. DI]|uniref:hypothetical protein n=1 Tax=Xenorhabdus doucetiae TaxID=351671 RepID=UPI0019B8D1AD|nr:MULTISPECIES: hypothetical protein [unclassified Xenorhabdus]MBD2784711.1 hypothetical protein [Xenorhabdus sp. 3]MBD2788935.1 hypothetical protein [Xenorhabdus sp. DI]
MNNDVIELARKIKRRSELVLQAERENNGEFYKHWGKLDLMMSPQNLIKLCGAVEKLAEYERIIGAYEQDNADWHKLADRDGSAICRLVDIVLNLQSKLAKYENMEPVAYYNLIDDEVRKSISEFDENKTIYAVPLYMCPNK